MAGLERFVDAQRATYVQALAELRAGAKRGHWIWFVFPQIAGLGRSETARFYAIADLAEARAYVGHPLLGTRLKEATEAILAWSGKRTLDALLGDLDGLKFCSSMTLFEAAGGGDIFSRALDSICAGHRDMRTLDLTDERPGNPFGPA
jgi:uncharacterized protein (DUF1810 family)